MSNVGATGDRVAALTQQLSASEATRIEAQAYQRATSEILQVMAGSPGNVAPVFEAIVQSSAELCEAEFSAITQFDGELLQLVAVSNMSAEELNAYRQLSPRPPSPGLSLVAHFWIVPPPTSKMSRKTQPMTPGP
jgi:hypothetical protein